jgi:tetratricopeptide (TPR) repeat protein
LPALSTFWHATWPERGCRGFAVVSDDADGHSNLGNALAAHGNLEEAIVEYRATIRIKPDLAEGHYNLGVALKHHRKLDEAIAEYRAAIRIRPGFGEAHCNLGLALANQGKRDEAIAELRKARDNAQSGPQLAQLTEKALSELDH